MRIDAGLIIGFIIECAAFIYYALSLFDKKPDKHFIPFAVAGYAIHFIIALFSIIWLNISVFLIVNLSLLLLCFKIRPVNALFHSCILLLISSIGEFIVFPRNMFFSFSAIDPYTSLAITLFGKTFYWACILLLIRLFVKSGERNVNAPPAALILIPILSIAIMLVLMCEWSYIITFLLLTAINIMSVIAAAAMAANERYSNELKEQLLKERAELEEYLRLKDSYEQISEMRHDFKEHLNTIGALISADSKKALEYIEELGSSTDSVFKELTDNTLLNIILHDKLRECRRLGISLEIEPVCAKLGFISGIDTVAIFSNLINNAVDSCASAKSKLIRLSFRQSGRLLAVKISNSCTDMPDHDGKELKTKKQDKTKHGIGMKSVKRALNNYDGELDWSCKGGIFTVKMLLKYPS